VTIDTREQAPTQAPPPHRRRRRVRLPRRPVAFLLALVFFFGPLGAFLLGARPQAIENRPLAQFPSPSDGWSFFPEFTTWATDHLPLRGEAVRGNAAFSERVFGEPPSYRTEAGTGGGPTAGVPSGDGTATDTTQQQGAQYPQVLAGKNGWLYYGQDAANLCQPTRTVPEVLTRLNRLAAAVQASGRRFVLTVAPDKSTIHPQDLPDTYLGKGCSEQRRSEFWQALARTPPSGYLDLRGPLESEIRRSGDPVYRPTDTHWGPRGAAVYVQALAGRLDPALAASTSVVETGRSTEPGDLGVMIGQPSDDPVQGVELSRPGVTPVGRDSLRLPEMPFGPETFTDTTSGAPLFGPKTLLLGDSFSSASADMLGGLFSSVTLLHNEVAGQYPQAVADLMVDNDVVVYEIVERTIASGRGALIEDASLDAIEKTLAAHPR
jgi:hypothetical protein